MPKTNLIPIKVRIKIGADGRHEYPQFNNLDSVVRDQMDWSKYFDSRGISWHYSQEGFGEGVDPDHWYGVTCVPKPFADAAVERFPDDVEAIPETELQRFYDEEAHVHDETEILDTQVLMGIAARVQLEESTAPTVEPDPEILELRRRVLDPSDPKPGIRRNPNRKRVDFKKRYNISLDKSVPK